MTDLNCGAVNLEIEEDEVIELDGFESEFDFDFDVCICNISWAYDYPRINNVELVGNKTGSELGLQDDMDALTVQEVEKILYIG